MSERLKRAVAPAVLGIISAFVVAWTTILHVPYLVHPDWASSANASVQPFAILMVILICVSCIDVPTHYLRIVTIMSVILTIIVMLGCLHFYTTIENIDKGKDVEAALEVWKFCYMISAVSIVASATLFGLWLSS